MIRAALALALGAASLYDQAVVTLLHERFTRPDVSYILIETGAGRVVDAQWPDASQAVAMGSLVKPFTTLAYGRSHGYRYPDFVCHGSESGCWLPAGHGKVGIVEAIAHSCNAYFDALAAQVRFEDVAAEARRFAIAPPPEDAPHLAYVGRQGLWETRPEDMLRAFVTLLADPRADVVRSGMAECARHGTGHALGEGLAKTGTAPCSHQPKAPGDGFVIAFDRATAPRYALLVRVHGVPGAEAAIVAGQVMRLLREGK
jgi:cell division protein FtsI/penicillin-binding protein 2